MSLSQLLDELEQARLKATQEHQEIIDFVGPINIKAEIKVNTLEKIIKACRVMREALEELSHDTDYPWGETEARKALAEADRMCGGGE